MNKTLTALAVSAAVSAALTAPITAQADVTIYGQARLALDYVNDGNFTSDTPINGRTDFPKEWRARVSSYSSRLGFKGFEDLGSGLKAIWQIETEVDMDGDGPAGTGPTSAGNSFSLRNTFAGLQSPFGTVLLGRHDTPFKIAVRELDFFNDTLADNRSITRVNGIASWDLRSPDVAAYISPDFMGAKLLAAYVAGGEEFSNLQGFAVGNGNATKGDAYSVAGIYKNGPIYASLAYERHNFGTPGTGSVAAPVGTINGANVSGKEEEAVRAGVGLEFGPAKIGGMFQRSDDNLGRVCGNQRGVDDSCLAHNVYNLGASFAFGPSVLKAQYTRATHTFDLENRAWQWTVGLDHNLSKRTQVYALYTHLHNDNGSALSLTSGSNQSTTDPLAAQGVGANPEGFSVGINHKF